MIECVFCDLLRDGGYAIDWDRFRVVANFVPLNPVTPGHRLFVPKMHVAHVAELPIVSGYVFQAAAEHGRERGEPFNLITSAGAVATQTVFHLHVHYVPRSEDDGLALPWTGQ